MRSYKIPAKIDLENFDLYLKNRYPVDVLSSAKNTIVLKIIGFYRILPYYFSKFALIRFILQHEAIVSINYIENKRLTTLTFSIFTSYYYSLFITSLIACLLVGISCNPSNYFEFIIYCFVFFLLFFLPGFLFAWYKHKHLVSILLK